MKPVLSSIIFILAASFITTETKAQHAGIFVHALYAAPTGGVSHDFYNAGAGVEGGILQVKNYKVCWFYWLSHFFSDNANVYGDKTYIPVKAGIRQYLPLCILFFYRQI